LPIAIGVLAATGQLSNKRLAEFEFAGELALTGELRPIRGALAMTLKAHRDRRAFILPQASATEAALVRDAIVHPARSLLQVCGHVSGKEPLPRQFATECTPNAIQHPDLAEVKGPTARQARARDRRRPALPADIVSL
jgi:magnesium chelatase family protein